MKGNTLNNRLSFKFGLYSCLRRPRHSICHFSSLKSMERHTKQLFASKMFLRELATTSCRLGQYGACCGVSGQQHIDLLEAKIKLQKQQKPTNKQTITVLVGEKGRVEWKNDGNEFHDKISGDPRKDPLSYTSLNHRHFCCSYSVLLTGAQCIKNTLSECGSDLPLQAQQGLQAMVSLIDFTCVEEFERQSQC